MANKGIITGCIILLLIIATLVSIYFQLNHHDHAKHNSVNLITPPVFNAIVSKNKPGAYSTIMEAIAAAPIYSNTRYYIKIEAGLYTERVEVWENKTNIALVGDGDHITRISWNRHFPEFRTFDTATVFVKGNGFIAMFLTFENTAGDGFQAVAVASSSDHSAFFRCTFLGYQDTLYAKQGLQFYRECNIYGTVDFIFGAAAAVFQSCNLFARLPRATTFTAQQKQLIGANSGFVIQNCMLTVAPGMEQQKYMFEAYLGRPWSGYSTVIVMESFLDSIIQPSGWQDWDSRSKDSLTYREYRNQGPGATTNGRVDWVGYTTLNDPNEVRRYTVAEFILGDENWLRETGIPYTSGFMHA